MNPVPSYQVIEFLEWLNNRWKYVDIENFDREIVLRLARDFLASEIQDDAPYNYRAPRQKILNRQPHTYTREKYTEPIDFRRSIDEEAHRLANSLRILIEGNYDIYDSAIASNHELCQRFLQISSGISKDLVQSLEFLNWLNKTYPKLEIQVDIRSEEINELVYLFCEEVGYKNGYNFSTQVKQWLRGEGAISLLKRLDNFLKKSRNRGYQNTGCNTFKRYTSVKLHGIFLFLSSGNFPNFIEEHWEDLNFLTGNYIDVYYSEDNLKNRISGHRILSDFKNLSVEVTSLPALVIWQDTLREARAIRLDKLPHEEIVKVMQQIVESVKSEKSLEETVKGAIYWVEQRLMELGIVVKQRGAIMVNEGDIYNVGQAGAVGKYARSDNNTFIQNIDQNIDEITALINSLRGIAQDFPTDRRDEILVHLDDLQEDIANPEKKTPQRIKTRLLALAVAVGTIASGVAGVADFSNNVLDLSQKLGVPIQAPGIQSNQQLPPSSSR